MMSTNFKKINKIAKVYDAKLSASDPRFRGCVIVHSQLDHAQFVYPNSFVEFIEINKQKWYIVFSEHYDYHIFNAEDVVAIAFSKRIKIKELKNK